MTDLTIVDNLALDGHQMKKAQQMKKFSSSQQALQSSRNSDLDLLLPPFYLGITNMTNCQNYQNWVSNIEELCQLLPYIKESFLSSDEHGDIESTLKFYVSTEYIRTLLLYKYTCAAQLNGEMYGARQSLHSSSSLVFARPNTTDTGTITGFGTKYFVVDAILNVDGTQTQNKLSLIGLVNMSIDIGFVTQLKCGVFFFSFFGTFMFHPGVKYFM